MAEQGPGRLKVRRERLFALLPRVFAAQPQDSVLGAIIELMAGALARLDQDLQRALHDRWVALASGEPPGRDTASALELLGQLLAVRRLEAEDTEAYRRRLVVTAKVLTEGLTTPRALLTLAIVALGAVPCPRLQRDQDATIAWGMPPHLPPTPGTRNQKPDTRHPTPKCSVCHAQGNGPCPSADRRVLEAWITDNPPMPRRRQLTVSPAGTEFEIANPSLSPDVPVLVLEAVGGIVRNPSVQNRDTGEVTLFAGELAPDERLRIRPSIDGYDLRLMSVGATDDLEDEGRRLVIVALIGTDLHIRIFDASGEKVVDKAEKELVGGETVTTLKQRLSLLPDEARLSQQEKQEIISNATSIAGHTRIDHDEAAPFDSYDEVAHHPWRLRRPEGSALLTRKGDAVDVANQMYYVSAHLFDREGSTLATSEAEDGTRFAVFERKIRTPRVRTGKDRWVSPAELSAADIAIGEKFDAETSTFATDDATDGTRFAFLEDTEEGSVDTGNGRVRLTVEWWARPPATFRLRIPSNTWVKEQPADAMALVRTSVERARAAGVQAMLEFPEPVLAEHQPLGDTVRTQATVRWQEPPIAKDAAIRMTAAARQSENHGLADTFSFQGLLDETRLDWSHFG